MPTTTSYGTWLNYTDAPTLEVWIAQGLGEFAADFDADGIATDYRAALAGALPDGVTLAGVEFWGPHPVTEGVERAISEAISATDLNPILERHDRVSPGVTVVSPTKGGPSPA